MPRILLHPGFHKTGTSSIQHFLWVNRDRVAQTASLYMLRHMKPVTDLCHAYSKTGNPLVLMDMVDRLDAVFANHTFDRRDVLISCEALSGHLPGWPGVATYAAAPVIWDYVVGYLCDKLATDDVQIVATTRGADTWLWSAYRHHLQGHRLTDDWETFRAAHAPAANFGAVLTDFDFPVTLLPLEQSKLHPQGAGGALLAAFGFDALDGFDIVRPGNIGPTQAIADEFLSLNRSPLPDSDLRAAKEALAAQHGVGHWNR